MSMQEYKTYKELRENWNTTADLFPLLKENGYTCKGNILNRWEVNGVIPKATRVLFKGKEWRVYSKDGADFKVIFDMLSKATKRISYKRNNELAHDQKRQG